MPLTATKENTAMTLPDPDDYEASVLATRPTKDLVTELLQLRRDELHGLRHNRDKERQRANDNAAAAKAWESADREAKALGRCVEAIEAMLEDERRARQNRTNLGAAYGGVTGYADFQRPIPPALEHPIGRILMHLAARYGQAIEAIAPPVPEGPVIVQAPRHLADAIRGMVEQEGYR